MAIFWEHNYQVDTVYMILFCQISLPSCRCHCRSQLDKISTDLFQDYDIDPFHNLHISLFFRLAVLLIMDFHCYKFWAFSSWTFALSRFYNHCRLKTYGYNRSQYMELNSYMMPPQLILLVSMFVQDMPYIRHQQLPNRQGTHWHYTHHTYLREDLLLLSCTYGTHDQHDWYLLFEYIQFHQICLRSLVRRRCQY